MDFFHINLGLTLFSLFFFLLFVADLLQRVIVLSTVSFFMIFSWVVQMTKFDPIESSDQIMFVSMLQIWNLRYFRLFTPKLKI